MLGVSGEAGQEAAIFLEDVYPALLPTVFAPVANIDITLGVYRHAVWVAKLAPLGAVAAELGDEVAAIGEFLHSMVLEVGNIDEAFIVHGDAPRRVQLALGAPLLAPGAQ